MNTFPLLSLTLLVALGANTPTALAQTGQILFSSNRSGTWRLWTMQANGSDIKPLTQRDADDHDVDPVFSPDGTTILFTSTQGGHTALWRMRPDGSQAEKLCPGDQAEWSPDGTRIVFRRNEQVLIRNLTNGTEQTLSPLDWPHCSGPSWSPDGTRIAFAARWDQGNAIFIAPAEGGKPIKVYDKQGACEPHWSPDGSRIVYETETHICTINPDGTKNRLITYFGGVQRYARYSPDGKSLVFCQGVSENGPWELYLIPAAGGSPRRLTQGHSDIHPDWKP